LVPVSGIALRGSFSVEKSPEQAEEFFWASAVRNLEAGVEAQKKSP
jgi:hypothetical protein